MEKRIVMAGLNIVIHPHTAQKYLDLIRKLFTLKRPIALRGTQYLMIGELGRVNRDEPLAGFFGRIYRFDHIDKDLPWFNVEDHSEATADEMAQVNIPNKLKPNLVMFDFVFFPQGHKMYIESKSHKKTLSAGSVKKLIDSLCSIPAVKKAFGDVEVTVMPDKELLETILGLHRLAKLIIDVKRPNPDDVGEDEEDRVFRRFDNMNTRRMLEIWTAESGQTILPDDDVQMMARVAATNGKVAAIGFSADGERIEESTVDRPWKRVISYDPSVQGGTDAFIQGAIAEHAGL